VIGGQASAGHQDEVLQDITEVKDKRKVPTDPKYTQPKWCPPGLGRTQRCKLQRAQQRKLKQEAMNGGLVRPEIIQEI